MTPKEQERLSVVETEIIGMRGQVEELKNRIRELWDKIDGLEIKLNTRLPLWATFILSLLAAIVTGLIVTVIK